MSEEESEVQRGSVTEPRSHSSAGNQMGQDLNSGPLPPGSWIFPHHDLHLIQQVLKSQSGRGHILEHVPEKSLTRLSITIFIGKPLKQKDENGGHKRDLIMLNYGDSQSG